jgi:glycine oxidase
MKASPDVVVVGGGVVGAAVAYYLSVEGARVQLLEREAIGSGCSFHGTGMAISILTGAQRKGPAFAINRASRCLISDVCSRIAEETGTDTLFQERPMLSVAMDEQEMAQRKVDMQWVSERGVPVRWLESNEVLALEPRTNPSVLGAIYEEGTAQVDGYRLTLAFAAAAEERGATVRQREVVGLEREGSRVTGVTTPTETVPCDAVVLAMGAGAGAASEWVGFPIPVRPLKGQILRLRLPGKPLDHFFNIPGLGTIVARRDGLTSLGTSYEDTDDPQPTEDYKLRVLSKGMEVLPFLAGAEVVEHLAGLRPLSADMCPIIGPVPGWEGLHLATGHGRWGIQLAPITGRLIADLLLRGTTSEALAMEHYLPARFEGFTPGPDSFRHPGSVTR